MSGGGCLRFFASCTIAIWYKFGLVRNGEGVYRLNRCTIRRIRKTKSKKVKSMPHYVTKSRLIKTIKRDLLYVLTFMLSVHALL